MLPAPIVASPEACRRFARRALLLDRPAGDVGTALAHLGYIQIDPINVCGRMHDLIARTRIAGYREGDLMRFLHGDGAPLAPGERGGFEHHLPSTGVLVAFPLDAWPHLLSAMRARTRRSGAWSGRLTPREKALAEEVLREIAARGALNSDAVEDDRRARPLWGQATLAKATLQKLFFHGRLLIARREGSRRFYDLPERVLPASVLGGNEPSARDTARWLAQLKLRQRRLATLKRDELALVEDLVQPVRVDGCPTLYCLRQDLPLFETGDADGREPCLLAPLDPLIYDRAVTSRLWNFDYTWEVYVPEAKRVRGYYALPILAGTELVGYVDPKADRKERRLLVVSRQVRRGHKIAPVIRQLADFLGLEGSTTVRRAGNSED